MYCQFHNCVFIRKKISSRTWVIPRTWIRNKVVFFLTKKDLEEKGIKVAELMMIKFGESGHPVFRATSPLSRGNAQKPRRWKIIYALLCRKGCDWNCFSHNHFCQSSQYLRNSLRFAWRVQYLSNKHRETVVAEQSDPLFAPADLLIMTPTPSDWNSCTRKSIAEAQRTSGKPSTTRINW